MELDINNDNKCIFLGLQIKKEKGKKKNKKKKCLKSDCVKLHCDKSAAYCNKL